MELRMKILQVYPLRMFQHLFGLICLFVCLFDRTVKHQAAVAVRAGVEPNLQPQQQLFMFSHKIKVYTIGNQYTNMLL